MSKQSNKPRDEDLKSSCFHHPKKGCEIVWFGYYGKNKKYIQNGVDDILGVEKKAYLNRGKCRTHQVKVCWCGWTVGTHGNQISKGYTPSL